MLSIPVVSFGLGTWQVYRWRWKLNLLDLMETRTKNEEPIDLPLPYNKKQYELLEYRRVKVKGHFDHSKEQYVGPRHRFDSGEFNVRKKEHFKRRKKIHSCLLFLFCINYFFVFEHLK